MISLGSWFAFPCSPAVGQSVRFGLCEKGYENLWELNHVYLEIDIWPDKFFRFLFRGPFWDVFVPTFGRF